MKDTFPRTNNGVLKSHFDRVVGEQVRDIRKRAGLSRAKLAALCGVAESTIHGIEDGRGCPLYIAARIAESVDDVTLDDLVPIGATALEVA